MSWEMFGVLYFLMGVYTAARCLVAFPFKNKRFVLGSTIITIMIITISPVFLGVLHGRKDRE